MCIYMLLYDKYMLNCNVYITTHKYYVHIIYAEKYPSFHICKNEDINNP